MSAAHAHPGQDGRSHAAGPAADRPEPGGTDARPPLIRHLTQRLFGGRVPAADWMHDRADFDVERRAVADALAADGQHLDAGY